MSDGPAGDERVMPPSDRQFSPRRLPVVSDGPPDAMASASIKRNGEPPADAVRAQVQRMTASDVFSTSPQLAAFLLFVVEAVLRGHAERLKGYTIGVEVLRRDSNF